MFWQNIGLFEKHWVFSKEWSKLLLPYPFCTRSCKHFLFKWDSLHARLNSYYEAWSCRKKKHKKVKAYRKSVQKEPTVEKSLLILDLKPLRSKFKWKHSIGKEFQSLAVREKKLNNKKKILWKKVAGELLLTERILVQNFWSLFFAFSTKCT